MQTQKNCFDYERTLKIDTFQLQNKLQKKEEWMKMKKERKKNERRKKKIDKGWRRKKLVDLVKVRFS